MNTTAPMNIAAMIPITVPTIAAMLGPEGFEGFVTPVGVLVELAAGEGESVEGKNGRRVDGIGTLTP